MTKFSSPFRGLFISTRKSSISSMKQIGFRPLSGVSLFLHIVECSVDLTSVFSSPFRGLFISTEIIMQRLSFAEPSFRPLSGVSLFLQRINQCEAITHMFSSPFRGLFISTLSSIPIINQGLKP